MADKKKKPIWPRSERADDMKKEMLIMQMLKALAGKKKKK